jgi:cytochrome c-type biogenesis protein CcmF
MNLGLWLVNGALLLGAFSLGSLLLGGYLGASSENVRRAAASGALWGYGLLTLALSIASALLLQAFLLDDFRYEYVVRWSAVDQPLIYKVSAFWGGQEGSFLLWALLIALIGLPVMLRYTRTKPSVSAAYLFTALVMLALTWWEHPFSRLEQAAEFGQGMNPLLLDPWMAIHPPMVFVGYAAMGVPFALAIGALVRKEYDEWAGPSLRWSLVCLLTLGAGIVMGGYWAYKVLGWGGYWAWDPVENSSLVPWLTGAALVHGLVAQRRMGGFRRTNLALALATYLLTLYATFLTRSGILADFSPHSFQESPIFRHMVSLMALVLLVSAGLFLWRLPSIKGTQVPARADRSFVVGGTLLFLLLSAAFVLFGTSWPIISGFLYPNPKVAELSFYNTTHAPVWLALGLLLVLGPVLVWMPGKWSRALRDAAPALLAGAAVTVAVVLWLGTEAVLPAPPEPPDEWKSPFLWYLFRVSLVLVFLAGAAATVSNLMRLVRDAKGGLLQLGAALAHVGLGLSIVGIVASSGFGQDANLSLVEGESATALDRTFRFVGERPGPEGEATHLWEIEVTGAGGRQRFGAPKFENQQQIRGDARSQKPAIIRSLGGDLYLSPKWKTPWRLDLLELPEGVRADVSRLPKDYTVLWGGYYLVFRGFQIINHEEGGVIARLDLVGREGVHRLNLQWNGEPGYLPGPPGEQRAVVFAGMNVDNRQATFVMEPTYGSLFTFSAATKPLIWVLWVGMVLAALGTAVAITRRFREAAAPAGQPAPAGPSRPAGLSELPRPAR